MTASLVILMRVIPMAGMGMRLMKLFGACRPLEIMAFAGNTDQGGGEDEQRKKFHRGAS
jgi:hypothetical protein